MSYRIIMRTLVTAALCCVAVAAQDKLPSAEAVLRELKAGNEHHVAKRYQHPHQTAARQREVAATQNPHAIILSCADSRVAPEIILDQGLGDLFDVRVAGNVATDTELASIEYAAAHLHTPLLVVMGHQKCGAVTAAAESGEAEGHLPSLLALIRPAVERARTQKGDLIDNAVRINVENVVRQIRSSKPMLSEFVNRGALTVVGAVYSLDTGKVAWLPENPTGPVTAGTSSRRSSGADSSAASLSPIPSRKSSWRR
jgi:carbonic anhydrase